MRWRQTPGMDVGVLRDDLVDGLRHESKGVLESDRLARAMRVVPRHEFVPEVSPQEAYQDRSFTHRGTTVLAPSTVAVLLEALDARSGDEVLVVGAGVGYTCAVLAEVVGARCVSAVDLSRWLVMEARRNLQRAGYGEVFVDCRDGVGGLPEYAPYDRILVEAACVDPPRRLVAQLAPGGRVVIPLGVSEQELTTVRASGDARGHGSVRFKPLLVEGEQAGGIERNRVVREEHERAVRAAERRRGWEFDWIDWDDTP